MVAQKVKNRALNIHAFINEAILCRRLCKLFHLKMTCTSCTYEARVKVPSFQKSHTFSTIKIFNRGVINLRFCLFEDVTDYCDVRKIHLKSFVPIGFLVFST